VLELDHKKTQALLYLRMTDIIFRPRSEFFEESELPRWWKTVDRWSLFSLVGLFLSGLLLGMAASAPLAEANGQQAFYYVNRQFMYGTFSFTCILGLSILSVQENRRIALICFLITFILLCALPIWGTDHGKGAVRWLSFFGFSLQPSEFLKPFFVVAIAWAISAGQKDKNIPGTAISFIITLLIVSLLVMQPDFGQAALFLSIWTIVYFVSGASYRLLVGFIFLTLIGGFMAYMNSEHFARRIDGFLSPDVDPRTQLGFATNSIQEGGLFGVGLGEGVIKWRLPDAHTDFIIAVAAEEYGVLICILIIIFFIIIVVRSLILLLDERDYFVRNCGVGSISFFAFQAIINLGVSVRLLPAKGMTLPFISYGGSSLIASGCLMGLLLACTRRRPQGNVNQ
tara:strand:- start:6342 stop:7535 length:1194 start_codon:yes stop_codon:yes gene_type:complete